MYLLGTENIKPSLFLRYPFQIAGPTFVEIPNRYQPKAKPCNSFFRMQILICRNAHYYGRGQ